MTDQSTPGGVAADALSDEAIQALFDEGRAAFAAGRPNVALSALQREVIFTALLWFRDEGANFGRPEPAGSVLELLIGLAIAARTEVAQRGEAASLKLQIAAQGLEVVAALRQALEGPVGEDPNEAAEHLAALILLGSDLGRIEGLMIQVREGLLDTLTKLEVDRERRRLGAAKTHALKETIKERALGEAVRIAGINPNLSNEDLAIKVRESMRLGQAVRTLTGWVRSWRQDGALPRAKC